MKVGIVGANGQVGTELAVILERDGVGEVVPIVRNALGSHFLRSQGFECRVADVTDEAAAADVLGDLDAVVVSAFAWQYSGEGFQSRGARRANEALVRNAVAYSPPETPVVYFSSLAAFGGDLGSASFSDFSLYTREKRNAERVLEAASDTHESPWYALRLGHVYGPNQSVTAALRADLAGRDTVRAPVDPDAPSNVVHTVTVADAVARCARATPPSGMYSVVNEPQWSWEAILERYAEPGTRLVFEPSPGGGSVRGLFGRVWRHLESRERTLRTVTLFLPERLNKRLFYEYLKHRRGGELARLRADDRLDRDAFEFDPVPGPFLEDLPPTAERLDGVGEDLDGTFRPG